jgi:mono/diheme cytochrome c family protein
MGVSANEGGSHDAYIYGGGSRALADDGSGLNQASIREIVGRSFGQGDGNMTQRAALIFGAALFLVFAGGYRPAYAHGDEEHAESSDTETVIEHMREMHEGHEHSHDFEAIEAMTPEEMERVVHAMIEIGIAVPPMDAHHGRELFVEKGCVVCHQVNGVGGEIGPSLDAAEMPVPMNTFEFAARMWRGAAAMIGMQQELFGDQISLTGQELADLIAFAHDAEEQSELNEAAIPKKFRDLIP